MHAACFQPVTGCVCRVAFLLPPSAFGPLCGNEEPLARTVPVFRHSLETGPQPQNFSQQTVIRAAQLTKPHHSTGWSCFCKLFSKGTHPRLFPRGFFVFPLLRFYAFTLGLKPPPTDPLPLQWPFLNRKPGGYYLGFLNFHFNNYQEIPVVYSPTLASLW